MRNFKNNTAHLNLAYGRFKFKDSITITNRQHVNIITRTDLNNIKKKQNCGRYKNNGY